MLLHLTPILFAFLAGPAPHRADATPPAGSVLAGDFVEVGNLPPGLSRDLALVEIVNSAGLALTAALGEGTAALAPEERLLVRLAPGEIPVLVTASRRPDLRLEGRILVERARRYTLELVVGPEEPEGDGVAAADAPATPPAAAATKAAQGEPARPAMTPATPAGGTKAAPPKPRRTGRVDVGRKRKKERG